MKPYNPAKLAAPKIGQIFGLNFCAARDEGTSGTAELPFFVIIFFYFFGAINGAIIRPLIAGIYW